jgi:hypothetical protein
MQFKGWGTDRLDRRVVMTELNKSSGLWLKVAVRFQVCKSSFEVFVRYEQVDIKKVAGCNIGINACKKVRNTFERNRQDADLVEQEGSRSCLGEDHLIALGAQGFDFGKQI